MKKRPNIRSRSGKRPSKKPKLSCIIKVTVLEDYMLVSLEFLYHLYVSGNILMFWDSGSLLLLAQGALLLTEVLKEREAQTELKQRIKSASKDVDKHFLDMVKTKEDKALKEEQEKAHQEKLERQAVAEHLKRQ